MYETHVEDEAQSRVNGIAAWTQIAWDCYLILNFVWQAAKNHAWCIGYDFWSNIEGIKAIKKGGGADISWEFSQQMQIWQTTPHPRISILKEMNHHPWDKKVD